MNRIPQLLGCNFILPFFNKKRFQSNSAKIENVEKCHGCGYTVTVLHSHCFSIQKATHLSSN